MKKLLALATSALLVAPLVASAYGPVEGNKSFTISGSGTSDNDFDQTAYGVSADLGYYLTDKWQTGLRQSVNGLANDNGPNEWAGSTRGYIQYNFLDHTYRPYLGVNLGGAYGESVKDTGTAGVEAGLKLYVLETTYINFGVEYSWLWEDGDDFENKANDGLYLYNIGVGFNW